jgi:hypothetical protein
MAVQATVVETYDELRAVTGGKEIAVIIQGRLGSYLQTAAWA